MTFDIVWKRILLIIQIQHSVNPFPVLNRNLRYTTEETLLSFHLSDLVTETEISSCIKIAIFLYDLTLAKICLVLSKPK